MSGTIHQFPALASVFSHTFSVCSGFDERLVQGYHWVFACSHVAMPSSSEDVVLGHSSTGSGDASSGAERDWHRLATAANVGLSDSESCAAPMFIDSAGEATIAPGADIAEEVLPATVDPYMESPALGSNATSEAAYRLSAMSDDELLAWFGEGSLCPNHILETGLRWMSLQQPLSFAMSCNLRTLLEQSSLLHNMYVFRSKLRDEYLLGFCKQLLDLHGQAPRRCLGPSQMDGESGNDDLFSGAPSTGATVEYFHGVSLQRVALALSLLGLQREEICKIGERRYFELYPPCSQGYKEAMHSQLADETQGLYGSSLLAFYKHFLDEAFHGFVEELAQLAEASCEATKAKRRETPVRQAQDLADLHTAEHLLLLFIEFQFNYVQRTAFEQRFAARQLEEALARQPHDAWGAAVNEFLSHDESERWAVYLIERECDHFWAPMRP